MRLTKEAHEKRALAILKSMEGLSIAEAQWLLNWCGECLLEQTVSFKKSEVQDLGAGETIVIKHG